MSTLSPRFVGAVAFACALLAGPAVHAQWEGEPLPTGGSEFFTARVVEIAEERRDVFAGIERLVQTVVLEIRSGAERGERVTIENGVLEGRQDQLLREGETIVLEKIRRIDGSTAYLIREQYRLPAMLLLTLFFVGLALVFGGKTGISAIFGLFISVLLLAKFVVPAIVRGNDPLFVSLIGAFVIACTSIYLAHGFTKCTSVALLSTLVTLAISAVLAVFFVRFANLFGMGSEEALFLQVGPTGQVNLRGLLLGGIIIGALGVLDDITTSQTATIHEISKANPKLTVSDLRKAGVSVGREHIASLINTLALAYVGSSLPLLLLFTINQDFPLWVTLNSEFLAEEVIRTLVGSSTLLLAVPISTWFAAYFMRGDMSSGGGHAHYH